MVSCLSLANPDDSSGLLDIRAKTTSELKRYYKRSSLSLQSLAHSNGMMNGYYLKSTSREPRWSVLHLHQAKLKKKK